MEQANLETINENLLRLMKVVQEMKEELEDRFLTAEEEIELEKSREEYQKSETISLEELKKKRNV